MPAGSFSQVSALPNCIEALRSRASSPAIKQGLSEALAFAEVNAQIHQMEVPTVDAAAIRARTGFLQDAFARSIGVAKGTLLLGVFEAHELEQRIAAEQEKTLCNIGVDI